MSIHPSRDVVLVRQAVRQFPVELGFSLNEFNIVSRVGEGTCITITKWKLTIK